MDIIVNRCISEDFVNSLKQGILHPILNRIKHDETLFLAIRKNYINVYYRGGNLVKIEEESSLSYKMSFNENYNNFENDDLKRKLPDLPKKIVSIEDSKIWSDYFPFLKERIDFHRYKNSELEREFQQLVVRENNYTKLSNSTDYFITDIEIADQELKAKFDMSAIQWLGANRKKCDTCRPVFIEMKYGNDSLKNSSGIKKHLEDFENLVADEDKYKILLNTMVSQFIQLRQLDLIRFGQQGNDNAVDSISDNNSRPTFIFLLANCNPNSTILNEVLNELDDYVKSLPFDVRFFVSNFAGYGFYEKTMLTIEEFRKFNNLKNIAKIR